MKSQALKTAIIGFGRIAALYAEDPMMAGCIPFATHAQVLTTHPDFRWVAVVDPSKKAQQLARSRWGVESTAARAQELSCREDIEVAVISAPPEVRLDPVLSLPNLRAVLVEKPLGRSSSDAEEFMRVCCERNVLVQVNLRRRAENTMLALACGGLSERIGAVQAAFGVYGNGLINNGTHMVDLVRLLLGEIRAVQAMTAQPSFTEGPIDGDVNLPFVMFVEGGSSVMMQPLRFTHYRECGLDFWGERGRLQVVQEGLIVVEYPTGACRSYQHGAEVVSDQASVTRTRYGTALYDMYTNLADALRSSTALLSPGDSAVQTSRIIDAVLTSAKLDGEVVLLRRDAATSGQAARRSPRAR